MSTRTHKTPAWDYSELAASYELRAPYAYAELWELLTRCGVPSAARVVDIGAGTGRLSRCLAERGHRVQAIEPCAPMRVIGQAKCRGLDVAWHPVDGVCTGLSAASADLVSYGSSFNVLPAAAAISEALRLLGGAGQVLVLWNHRDLDDPLQRGIEDLIRQFAPTYTGGSRRENPLPVWQEFAEVEQSTTLAAPLQVHQSTADFIAGFRAHGTVIRHLGDRLEGFLQSLTALLDSACPDGQIAVPFTTRAWCMRVRARAHRSSHASLTSATCA